MGLFGLTPSDVTGGIGDLLGTGLDVWNKNQQYELEKKRLELEAATKRNQTAQTTAAAADMYNQAINSQTLQKVVQYGAIAMLGVTAAVVVSRFLGGMLRKV